MKKLFFAAFVAAIAFAVNANAQISVGVGYANETVVSKEAEKLGEDVKGHSWAKSRMKLDGIYVEFAYNWELASVGPGAISLQPGIRYNWLTNNEAAGSMRYSAEVDDKKQKVNLTTRERSANHFIDVPLHVKYSYEFVPGALKAYAFAGPVFSLGLAARSVSYTKGKTTNGVESVKLYGVEKINAYTGKYYSKSYDLITEDYEIEKLRSDEYKAFNMFDLKLALGLGITVSEKVDVKFGYNIGLLNRSFMKNDEDTKYSAHSNVLYFGVSYNF